MKRFAVVAAVFILPLVAINAADQYIGYRFVFEQTISPAQWATLNSIEPVVYLAHFAVVAATVWFLYRADIKKAVGELGR